MCVFFFNQKKNICMTGESGPPPTSYWKCVPWLALEKPPGFGWMFVWITWTRRQIDLTPSNGNPRGCALHTSGRLVVCACVCVCVWRGVWCVRDARHLSGPICGFTHQSDTAEWCAPLIGSPFHPNPKSPQTTNQLLLFFAPGPDNRITFALTGLNWKSRLLLSYFLSVC